MTDKLKNLAVENDGEGLPVELDTNPRSGCKPHTSSPAPSGAGTQSGLDIRSAMMLLDSLDRIADGFRTVEPCRHNNDNLISDLKIELAGLRAALSQPAPSALREALPSPETLLAYANILEKPKFDIRNGVKYPLPNGEATEAAIKTLRICAALNSHPHVSAGTGEPVADTAALGTAGGVERPPYPTGEADKKLAEDWYTWGFQAGLDSARSAPSPAALDPVTVEQPTSPSVDGETLLPCPFCGGEAKLETGQHNFEDAQICCTGCGMYGPDFDQDTGLGGDGSDPKPDAIKHWNNRALSRSEAPVAWRYVWPDGQFSFYTTKPPSFTDAEPLYAAPSPDTRVREALVIKFAYEEISDDYERFEFLGCYLVGKLDQWPEFKAYALAALPQPGAVEPDATQQQRSSMMFARSKAAAPIPAVEPSEEVINIRTASEIEAERLERKRAVKAVGLDPATVEACAKIADPWPGFWPLDEATPTDLAIIEVRKKIAAAIRASNADTSTVRVPFLTDAMIQAGARAMNPPAFEEDEYGNYFRETKYRREARKEAREVIVAALNAVSQTDRAGDSK